MRPETQVTGALMTVEAPALGRRERTELSRVVRGVTLPGATPPGGGVLVTLGASRHLTLQAKAPRSEAGRGEAGGRILESSLPF